MDIQAPSYCELTLSDEEKSQLVKKCVHLLLSGITKEQQVSNKVE